MARSSTCSKPQAQTAADLLAERWPTLKRYCPILPSVSAQQAAFLILDQRECFYGGAAGGGKSAALLMAALQYVDVPGYAALLLRRTFPQLTQPKMLIPLSKEWLGPHRDVRWNEQQKEWTFPSGAVIRFGHLSDESAIFNYQGGAYALIGFDELTQFTPEMYEYVAFSRARRDTTLKRAGVPIRVRSTANPGGVGHGWVKARLVDENTRKPGTVFIPARVADNPGLDVVDYTESLSHLGETLRRQLLDGDWGAFEGAAFTVTADHLVERFELRDSFERFEAADYGLNGAPWCLWAVDYEGNLIAVDMLYERDVLPGDVARRVLAKRKAGWGDGLRAYLDPSIWHRTGARNKWGAPAMLADEFPDNGVPVIPANNDPRAGLIRVRTLLAPDPARLFPSWHPRAGEPGAPRMFFTPECAPLVSELRDAPLQPIDKRDGGEIVDPEWESRHGHAVAMCRYAVMTRPEPSSEPPIPEHLLHLQPPDDERELRRRALREHKERVQDPYAHFQRRDYDT